MEQSKVSKIHELFSSISIYILIFISRLFVVFDHIYFIFLLSSLSYVFIPQVSQSVPTFRPDVYTETLRTLGFLLLVNT